MDTGSTTTFSEFFTFSATSPAPVLEAVLSALKATVASIWLGFSIGTKAASLECFSFGQFTVVLLLSFIVGRMLHLVFYYDRLFCRRRLCDRRSPRLRFCRRLMHLVRK